MSIFLDDVMIFTGQIVRACGSIVGNIQTFSEVNNLLVWHAIQLNLDHRVFRPLCDRFQEEKSINLLLSS